MDNLDLDWVDERLRQAQKEDTEGERRKLRDRFAMAALTGLTGDGTYEPNDYEETVAEFCYRLADEMLAAREEVEGV